MATLTGCDCATEKRSEMVCSSVMVSSTVSASSTASETVARLTRQMQVICPSKPKKATCGAFSLRGLLCQAIASNTMARSFAIRHAALLDLGSATLLILSPALLVENKSITSAIFRTYERQAPICTSAERRMFV